MFLSSRSIERHNENVEMRFDCLAQADEDDIDLRISYHALNASASTSQQDNEIDQILKLCTWWEQILYSIPFGTVVFNGYQRVPSIKT